MSYLDLDQLLEQAEPLEKHEIDDLREWLATLNDDVDLFGATAEDARRMARIRAKIAEAQP